MTGFDIDSLIATVRINPNKQGLIWDLERLKQYLVRSMTGSIRTQGLELISKAVDLLNSDGMLFLLQNDIIAALEDLKGLIDESNDLDLSLCDAVIITVTDVEYSAVVNVGEWEECKFTDTKVSLNLLGLKAMQTVLAGKKIVLLKQRQMGMVEAAVVTEKVIAYLRPETVIACGIAASIKPDKVKINDIVVVEECWDYGNGKIEGALDTESFFHSASHSKSLGIIQIITDKKNDIKERLIDWQKEFLHVDSLRDNAEIHIGKMVSGAAVVKSEIVKDVIKKESLDVLALDMETYGFYYTLERRNSNNTIPIKYVTIKSIADYADKDKKDYDQGRAAFLSAKTALHVVSQLL